MKQSGFDFDVRKAGTSLLDVPSRYAKKLLRPLHRGAPMEAARDLLLAASPAWRSWFPEWAARNAALVNAVASTAGVGLVADSSKTAVRLKYLRRVSGLRIKVIHLVRDGRAVALTYMRPHLFADAADPKLRGGGSGKVRDLELSMTEAAHEWRRSNEEARQVLRTFPAERQIRITYEELCKDPRSVMGGVHRFLGVQEDDSYKGFRKAPHHVVGNGMRLDDTSEVALDDRWRETLTAAERREFDRVAGSLNHSFGYR
jgi:Sulfotransferase family